MARIHRRAFTLIELLVVIGIIGVLASITIAALSGAGNKGRSSKAKSMIETIKLAIENYSNDFGDYPPSRARYAGLSSNGLNDGNECLVRCLTTTKKQANYHDFNDADLANRDNDKTKKNGPRSAITKPELFEVVDPWGNPFVYLHNADYSRGGKVSVLSEDKDHPGYVVVKGHKSDKTGQYHDLNSFQMWSLGPDGKDDGGAGDDIVSWN